MPAPSPGTAVGSYPTVSPLPSVEGDGRRSGFCGTFHRLAPPGRYPAPCSVEPGLSSNEPLCPVRDRPLLLASNYSISSFQVDRKLLILDSAVEDRVVRVNRLCFRSSDHTSLSPFWRSVLELVERPIANAPATLRLFAKLRAARAQEPRSGFNCRI